MDNYKKGLLGERVLERAFQLNIIPNFQYQANISPFIEIDGINPIQVAKINQINGDFMFTTLECRIEFIDAKNGNWISKKALDNIRDGAYIAFNMYHNSRPFIVRADVEFKSFARKIPLTPRVKGDDGYAIMWNSLPKEVQMFEFDEDEFEKMRLELMIEDEQLAKETNGEISNTIVNTL